MSRSAALRFVPSLIKACCLGLGFVICAPITVSSADTNLVFNGSFESNVPRSDTPDGWTAAGNPAVKLRLVRDAGHDGEFSAKLECTEFAGDGPDYHAMICQVGRVSVRRDHWYRLAFWVKGQGIKGGAVEAALSNTRPWENAGLADAFRTSARWERFEFLFRAKFDLPATTSRLQFWFKSTGTLWLDEVELTESAEGQQWFPQISTENVKNFVPKACERIVNREGTIACFFRSGGRTLAIAWRDGEGKKPLKPVWGVTVRDIMGNPVEANAPVLSETPIYLLGANADLVERALP